MKGQPANASVAHAAEGAKLSAPSALRNGPVLLALLREVAPSAGRALEIASGTGEQIVTFAKALPDIDWHPTEIDPLRLASIDAYRAESPLPNLRAARLLDAAATGWGTAETPYDLIHLTNLLHLISDAAAMTVIHEAASALSRGGIFMLHGPFRRSGALTSEGDARFDADLRAANPMIGYKDDLWIKEHLSNAGLAVRLIRDMPANNLAFIVEKR